MRHREYNRVFDNRGKDKNADNANKKENEEKRKKSAMPESYSFGTSASTNPQEKGKMSNNTKEPVEGDKCPVPGCTKTLAKGPQNHLYIVQCPMLKKQKATTLLNWFHQKGYKCAHCFSKVHDSSDCQFREFKCKRQVADKNGRPRYCGKSHHLALHDEKTDGKILSPNHDQQYPKHQNRQPKSRD